MPEKVIPAPDVPPFVTFVTSAVPMVFDNSMSYYEALCALWKWLQDDVVDVINNNASVTNDYIDLTNEYTEKFIELKNYVDTYFDNLDVQEEINNKLDAMVEDGTLQTLINNFLQPNVTWTFDTVADMAASTNLVAGGYARTLGFHVLNDGGGATYYITDSGTADEMQVIEVGSLYANLVLPAVVTPEMLGAKGDGLTDDKDCIQKAITLSSEVKFKTGATYYLTDSINLHSNLKINGNNAIFKSNNSNGFIGENLTNIEIFGFTTDNVRRMVEIVTSNNIHIHDMTISTTSWGIALRLCNNFVVEDIVFNQLRTSSYSNKDGVHINGGKNGVIRNIYGTTDDDMIALNADESGETIGDITDIIIDHVVTKNSQDYGATDSTYRGIKLLSKTSLIDNITIKNCHISSDYEECLIMTSLSSGSGNIGRVYIDNCVFTKNHNRTGRVIYCEIGYKELTITNSKLIYNSTATGSLYDEIGGGSDGKVTLTNNEYIDNSGSERAYLAFRNSVNELNINNSYLTSSNDYQFLNIRGNVKLINLSNIYAYHPHYLFRIINTGNVESMNIENVNVSTATNVVEISGQLGNLNINNLITASVTVPISVSADQTGLIFTGNNISGSVRTIDVSTHTNNIRLKGSIVTNFTPSVGSVGDYFFYSTGTTSTASCVYKLYSGGSWVEIQTA